MHVSQTNPTTATSPYEIYLAIETSLAVVKNNKLARLVEEAVAAITVPASTREFITSDGRRIIQADHE
jgi:hypothetical protein